MCGGDFDIAWHIVRFELGDIFKEPIIVQY